MEYDAITGFAVDYLIIAWTGFVIFAGIAFVTSHINRKTTEKFTNEN
jgi:large-conductance mechanosensitive channel